MKLSRKRILSFTAILLFLIGLIFMAVYLKSVADYKRAVKETTFNNLDISNVPDGIYIGEYDVDFVYAKVEVTVQNGVITNIDILEHKNGRGSRAEVVVDRIVEEQKIEVDAVSGATNSSTVIKKAVENALTGEKYKMNGKTEWIYCPVCGNKTRLQIRLDTELKNFPLYCPKCKQENLIDVKELHITVIKKQFE